MDNFETLPHCQNQSWQVERQGAVPESSIVQQMSRLLALAQTLGQVLECLETTNRLEQLVWLAQVP